MSSCKIEYLVQFYKITHQYNMEKEYNLSGHGGLCMQRCIKDFNATKQTVSQKFNLNMVKLYLQNESIESYYVIPDHIRNLSEIAKLIQVMHLASHIAGGDINKTNLNIDSGNVSGNSSQDYTAIVELLDDIDKNDLAQRLEVHIHTRKSDENFHSWWRNVTKILPKNTVDQIVERVDIVKNLYAAPEVQLTAEEMANFEAMVAYKVKHTGPLPLYKILEHRYENSCDKITLDFYKKIYSDDPKAIEIITKLAGGYKFEGQEKVEAQNYLLAKSKSGCYFAKVDEDDLMKIMIKDENIAKMIMELKDNIDFSNEGRIAIDTVGRTYSKLS